MKDPAFLFYSQDFLVGTLTMSFEDKGKYITILSYMHQQGRLTEETISLLVGSISVNLKSKFAIDKNGLWYNKRLETETEKRTKFVESRINNGKQGGRPKKEKKPLGYPSDNLIENDNENENKDEIEDKNNNWRTNFEIYKEELRVEYLKLINDNEFILQQEKYNPGVDIRLSIQKACVNYWSTEAGWKHKKSKRSNTIDWKATLTNAIGMNKVYKSKEQPKDEKKVYQGAFIKRGKEQPIIDLIPQQYKDEITRQDNN